MAERRNNNRIIFEILFVLKRIQLIVNANIYLHETVDDKFKFTVTFFSFSFHVRAVNKLKKAGN